MKQAVAIVVKNTQTAWGERQVYTTRANGMYNDLTQLLTYREEQEDGQHCTTTIRKTAVGVEVHKMGDLRTEMCFLPGGETTCRYQTAIGVHEMTIATEVATMTENDTGVTVHLVYGLCMDGQKVGHNKMVIEARYIKE